MKGAVGHKLLIISLYASIKKKGGCIVSEGVLIQMQAFPQDHREWKALNGKWSGAFVQVR